MNKIFTLLLAASLSLAASAQAPASAPSADPLKPAVTGNSAHAGKNTAATAAAPSRKASSMTKRTHKKPGKHKGKGRKTTTPLKG